MYLEVAQCQTYHETFKTFIHSSSLQLNRVWVFICNGNIFLDENICLNEKSKNIFVVQMETNTFKKQTNETKQKSLLHCSISRIPNLTTDSLSWVSSQHCTPPTRKLAMSDGWTLQDTCCDGCTLRKTLGHPGAPTNETTENHISQLFCENSTFPVYLLTSWLKTFVLYNAVC